MRTNLKNTLFIMGFFLFGIVHAQEKTITGTLTDESGEVLPGAYIEIKGSQKSVETDENGNYEIQANPGDILIYSFIGLPDVEKIVGESNSMNIQLLETENNQIDQVVVTALGISRDKKSLGYATQEVSGEDVSTVKSGNVANSLSGKVAGIQIKRSTNLGGSSNVIIRGSTSLTGNNQALWVVDGVPIDNTNTNGSAQQQGGKGYDYGNPASDINPDDIESINVLKGAAATALYGSRAANGAIIVTTKKGKKKSGIGITINSGVTIGTVNKKTFPKYQKQYGQGYGPFYNTPFFNQQDVNGDGTLDLVVPTTEDASYGAAFDPNLLVYQWDSFDPESPNFGKATPWVAAENDPIKFFETAVTYNNSIALNGGGDNSSFRISYTNFRQEGILPNSELNKNNFSFKGSLDLTDKLTASGAVNYIKTDAKGRNSTGYTGNILTNFRQWWPVNVDINAQKNAYFSTGRNLTWNYANVNDPTSSDYLSPIFWDNPYWTRYQNYQNDNRDRWYGNMSLKYDVADWFDILGQVTADTYSEEREERLAIGSIATPFGIPDDKGARADQSSGYSRYNKTFNEYNFNLFLNFNKDLTDNFNFKGLLGSNIRRQEVSSVFQATNGGLSVPNLYSLNNSKDTLLRPIEVFEPINTYGIFGSASFGYNDMLYLDATLRRDYSTTLPAGNNVYWYPSVATSFVFSKLIKPNWLSFGKLRLNYAEVGSDAAFGKTSNTYNVANGITGQFSVNPNRNNENLKPERTSSWETGLEMAFLKRRAGFDLALYQTRTKDQITDVRVSSATGYNSRTLNAGELENKGIELTLYGTPIKTSKFSWDINVNWAKNQSEVTSLYEGLDNLQLGSFQGGVTINATPGQPYGTIQGSDYTYLNGERVVDATTGQYIPTNESNKVIGNVQPNWNAGIRNKFSYKNLSFSFLIDIQDGGDIFSLDQYYGLATGLYKETAFTNQNGVSNRLPLDQGGGFINPGVNPDGSTNTTSIRADRFGAQGYRRGLPNSAFVYDASYIKLREASITYNLPDNLLESTFLQAMSFTIIGSNLWIIDKNLPHADPESGTSFGNLQGWQSGVLPTTRDIGFNLKLQF